MQAMVLKPPLMVVLGKDREANNFSEAFCLPAFSYLQKQETAAKWGLYHSNIHLSGHSND